MTKKILLVFLTIISIQFSFSQNVSIGSVVSTDSLLVGDQFVFKYGISGDLDSLKWQKIKDTIGPFEIIKELKTDTSFKPHKQIEKSYVLTYFDAGNKTLPPLYFTNGRDTFYTNEHLITVLPVAIDSTNAFLNNYTNPIEIPTHIDEILYYVYWALGIIAILVLIYFLFKKFYKKEETKEVPKVIIPAHILALGQLSDFKSKDYLKDNQVKNYYSDLSDILRTYLENRYQFLAMESTTDEIMKDLKKQVYQTERNKEIEDFLTSADLVKFAKATPEEYKHEVFLKNIEEFIHLTKLKKEDGDEG